MVDIAVLLILHTHFRRDTHTACAASQKAAVGARVVLDGLPVASAPQDGVGSVPKVFCDDRLVLAFVYFAAIAEVSVVERILQNE